jgi:cytochrome c oxidase cbb3-type subunit III
MEAVVTTAEATGDQIVIDDDEVEQAELLDHTYDGIREYDNPLPSWWRISFVGTIVFAGFYALYFHVVDWGSTPDDNYRATLAAYDEQRGAREAAEIASIDELALAQKASTGGTIARGGEVFATRCASCHGPAGAGLIGPNLTDEMQKHGMTRMDLYMTVRRGVPGTAMVSWAEQLPAPDLVAVTAFVISLRGTNVPGKPPEGAPVGKFAP